MNGLELKLARQLIGLSVSECAEHIGKVSKRSWEYWETERSPVKEDVADYMAMLLERRREIIKQVAAMGENAKKIAVIYYKTPEHCESVIEWRFTQTLCAMLVLDFGAKLVDFDFADYQNFCAKNKIEDSKENRARWATSKNI